MSQLNEKRFAIALLLVMTAALATACSGPFVVFPGGALDGPVEPVPASFEPFADVETIQLETRPHDPYSVNVVGAVVGERLYVSGGGGKTTWIENIEADPRVRARIEGVVYELGAHRVEDDAEIAEFGEVWTEKVAFGRDPTQFDEVWIYRLEAR
ncbi:MAG: nitroreductase family deazaflavin-dependent oxidoreductase [Deltaproteobacteria bacterium]|nr:nitroreductase family deazaflavin-dependent oxidoreductase [Deltaproteobacteria bacterium]MBW2416432.1 nitroreductase family deazaflavin-dependent oxidoreductase [Deltaproteobacteria bacterium]